MISWYRRAGMMTAMERRERVFSVLRSCAAIVALVLIGAFVRAIAQSVPMRNGASARENRALRAFLHTFDAEINDSFTAVFRDLNGDHTPEAIAYLTSSSECGSSGCSMLILARDGGSWRLVTSVGLTNPPIKLLPTVSHGWRNIGVWVEGGGIHPGYEAELRFDGKTYPENPTVAPARPMKGKVLGETLIAFVPR